MLLRSSKEHLILLYNHFEVPMQPPIYITDILFINDQGKGRDNHIIKMP